MSHAVPLFVAIADVGRDVLEEHLTRAGELFFYVAFANADDNQIQKRLNEYALVRTKQYERNSYTLNLYTFRFAFAS